MRVRNTWIRLALPVVLIALVALLATLQYRWLGQVSEAERAQLLRSLTDRAREFADAFDSELTQAYQAHQASRAAQAAGDWSALAAGMDHWRASARFPGIVRAVYLAERNSDGVLLHRFVPGAHASFETGAIAWPPHLDAVRKQLAGMPSPLRQLAAGNPRMFAITLTPVMADGSALVIPLTPAVPQPVSLSEPARGAVSIIASTGPDAGHAEFNSYIVVDIDRACLVNTVLPALVERYFPVGGGDGYRVAVLAPDGRPVFSRGVPPGEAPPGDRADVSQSFFAVRPDAVRGGLASGNTVVFRSLAPPAHQAGRPPAGEITGGTAAAPSRMTVYLEQRVTTAADGRGAVGPFRATPPGWRVVAQHPAGSLDAAVARVRVRNLWLSFGILAILAAGLIVVIVNANRAEQLAARQIAFVATVSHELRTPLAVIRSAAQNLSAGVVSGADHTKRYGDVIDGESRRLGDLVEQVLTLSSLESGRRLQSTRPVIVAALVDEEVAASRSLLDAAGMTVDVSADGAAAALTAMADEAALRRALHNLIANAAKHGSDGRWLGIRIAGETTRRRRDVRIDISDRGRGIDPADLPHVFEPFRRGRHAMEQQIQGSGLGLSLVKRIAEAHGGRVGVSSERGAGATFTIWLPEAGPAPAEPASP